MEKVLEILLSWVGYLEKQSNKDLDHKTRNAGNKNYTCFARDYKTYTGANFQGQAWCAMFISVCFVVAYGLEVAKKMLCGQLYAYCPYGMAAFKKKGQLHTTPKAGDIVFFLKNGIAKHTGFVYKVSGKTIYTIEGNTSGASGVVANGGGVCRKSYTVNSNMRFGRPDYSLAETQNTSENACEPQIATKNTKDELTKAGFIKGVQKAVNVAVDGIVGENTRAALPTLKKGSKGTVVKYVQLALIEIYGYELPKYGADGDFGNETVAAVKKFQKAKGLEVDGVIGKNTWKALLE